MKFGVQTWLLYSIFIGWIPAAVVVPILLLNFEVPSFIAVLCGCAAALVTGLLLELHNIFHIRRISKENEKNRAKQEQEQMLQAEKDFCADCRKFHISSSSDLSYPEKKQRFALIAKKHKLDGLDTAQLLAILKEGTAAYAAEQKKQKVLEQQREQERRQRDEMQLYDRFHGTDKTQEMVASKLVLLSARLEKI